jgi:hypothetical protein
LQIGAYILLNQWLKNTAQATEDREEQTHRIPSGFDKRGLFSTIDNDHNCVATFGAERRKNFGFP